jgi:hypothetical protein
MKETGECLSRRPSIGVDHATRVRYSIMVRIRPSRKLFSAENEKKRPIAVSMARNESETCIKRTKLAHMARGS